MNNKRILNWIKEHKVELIIAGVSAIGVAVAFKNRDAIKCAFKACEEESPKSVKAKVIEEIKTVPVIPDGILDKLTGNKLTARDLGKKALCSAQEINKRIVAAGLAIKKPNGTYDITEKGKPFGIGTCKTTAAGHSFSNNEWDEIVLEIIFGPDELHEIERKHEWSRNFYAA